MTTSTRLPVSDRAVRLIAMGARPLVGTASDFNPLLALIGDARSVLIGEASHGTAAC